MFRIPSRSNLIVGFTLIGLCLVTLVVLRQEGRLWWCACARWYPWSSHVASSHNSQHLFDPYSFTHGLQGMLCCGLLSLIARPVPLCWRFCIAVAIECLWEIIENTDTVIDRY